MKFEKNYDFNKNQCLVEQYKLYVEMLEGSNKRRMDTNTFFITITALMVTVASLFSKGDMPAPALALVCGTGFFFSVIWYVLLRNYNVVNKAKWNVLNEMEAHLQCNPFESEWPKMQHEKYSSISVLERSLPIVFALVYVAIGLYGAFKGKGNPSDLTATVTALQDAVSDLTAAIAEIARAGIGG